MSPSTTFPLNTRATPAKDFKRVDRGYGWGRICVEPGCGTRIHHLHKGDLCYQCDERREREERAAADWKAEIEQRSEGKA